MSDFSHPASNIYRKLRSRWHTCISRTVCTQTQARARTQTHTDTHAHTRCKLGECGCPYNSSVTPPFGMINWWPEKWICFQLVTHQRNNNSVRGRVAGWWMGWTAGSQRSNGVSEWVREREMEEWGCEREKTVKSTRKQKQCQAAEMVSLCGL